MNEKLHDYYMNKEEPNKSCLFVLRDIILEQDEQITESIKWNSPCFSYKNRMFCFFMIDKKTNQPYLLMRSEEHTSELQSRPHLVCRLLLEKKKKKKIQTK